MGSKRGGGCCQMGEYKWARINGGRSYFVCYAVLCVVFSDMNVLHELCCVLMCVAGCVMLYSEL